MTNLTSRLYAAWKEAVLDEKIVNLFEASKDDVAGHWSKGDQIVYGIRSIGEELTYYAQNLTRSHEIKGGTERKQLGDTGYICQFNSYRALRPGASNRPIGRQPDIPAAPEDCRFHCQDATHPISLLRREPLLTAKFNHANWHAYYNVAPLDQDGHFLWVPTGPHPNLLPHSPQQLSFESLDDAIQIFNQLTQTILFFNTLHAGASVNHIHLQALYHRYPLPIESATVIDYKGYRLLDNYPIQAIVFSTQTPATEIFACVDRLQRETIPFNLIMVKDHILVVVRNIDHEIVSEFPGDGFAALGMCGVITTVDRNAYDTVTVAMIESTFAKMVVPAQQVIDRWLGK
ncbi:GDP-D-glucose phosphorylase 1 family protein [Leptothoe spongobia]|uniref:GDP-D-glucose phosphorylase n=1 Tax=Leptothoe spongobia TAU-MAC 1115 TaxID=1967444 RepID=A0A947DGD9_9CYAN|nr:hypothetical protein [Leptothoe spongobia]MBT9316083.1 hypothetical protein [Leptothoe spongobia TAU-MAC 1115]